MSNFAKIDLDLTDNIIYKLMKAKSIEPIAKQNFCAENKTYLLYFGWLPMAGPPLDYYTILLDYESGKWEGYELFYRGVLIYDNDHTKRNTRVMSLHVNSITVPPDFRTKCSWESFLASQAAGTINHEGYFKEPDWYRTCGCFVPKARKATGSLEALKKVQEIIASADRLSKLEQARGCEGAICLAIQYWRLLKIVSSDWLESMEGRYKAIMHSPPKILELIYQMTQVERNWKRFHVVYGPNKFIASEKEEYYVVPYFIKAVPHDTEINVFLASIGHMARWICQLTIRDKGYSISLYRSEGVYAADTGRLNPFYEKHFDLQAPSSAHQELRPHRELPTKKSSPKKKPGSRTGPMELEDKSDYSVSSLASSRSSSQGSGKHPTIMPKKVEEWEAAKGPAHSLSSARPPAFPKALLPSSYGPWVQWYIPFAIPVHSPARPCGPPLSSYISWAIPVHSPASSYGPPASSYGPSLASDATVRGRSSKSSLVRSSRSDMRIPADVDIPGPKFTFDHINLESLFVKHCCFLMPPEGRDNSMMSVINTIHKIYEDHNSKSSKSRR